MGELKEEPKNETEKKPEGEAKKDEGPAPIVLKLDMHCEGCVKKIKRSVRHLDGVEDVKADMSSNKLTVFGKVDPTLVQGKLAEKTKKKVALISPQPKKDAGADKKSDEKPPEKKAEEKKPEEKKPEEDKKPKESTVILKIRLHCDGCISKIRRIILKIKGVESVEIDGAKDLVAVKGTMDVKELTPYLKDKLKRNVEVVPPPKKDDDKKEKGGGGDKKEAEAKPAAGGDGEKKEEAPKVEANKMEYYGFPPPTFWHDGHVPSEPSHAMEVHPGYVNQGHYGNPMYVNQGYPAAPPPFYMPPPHPQMFSDENPNACSVM
ncbi:heavy metal-associated isoprenylated plant protein 6-like isoform X1 [Neltuma alba]|uniref:heavy metal-associated isoprenylated plant protein 6-like isoform X1 n=2 Tax=Neltuma alba TaxID=207710 RepID=UPI0010A3FEAE|nr:heavy metal-associated isoprenylated plant protein 6-like isoform X1 [Prosopis alba]